MNYEKKYKEALERAKKGKCLENIFPELRESEEERIRKELLDYLDERRVVERFTDIRVKEEWIAWLEKQGEQKPADKVEPKFHKGEWITNGDYTWKIVEVKPLDYILQSQDGNVVDDTISHVDEQFHSFTIQDAKDGDVLEFGDHGRLVVGIVSFVNKTTGKVDVNCLLENNNFKVGNYYNLDTIKPHPATKEQRDLLFQGMKEAGYEWDAEKKELRKTEQKPDWSEEDEKFFKTALWHISHSISNGKSTDIHCDSTDWLKSLKDRVTAKARME